MEEVIKDLCKSRGIPQEQIETYINSTIFEKKQYICAYWLRGTCVFPKEICHHAHGFDDLTYMITSNNVKQPFFSEEITTKNYYFDLPRKYYVLEGVQRTQFVQEELKKYFQSMSIEHDSNQIYTLQDLQNNKKVRGIILTYMLLSELIKYMKYVFNQFGEKELLPKKILVHELQRCGFCQIGQSSVNNFLIGGKTYKPGTIIFHLQSFGVCFQTDLLIPGFSIIDNHKNNNAKKQDKKIEQQQPRQKEQFDDEEDENIEEEEVEEEEIQQGEKEAFIIPIHDINQLKNNFTYIFTECLQFLILEAKENLQYEDVQTAVDEKIDEHNQKNIQNVSQLLPKLEQFLKIINIPFDTFYLEIKQESWPQLSIGMNCGFDQCGVSLEIIQRSYNDRQKQCLAEYISRPFQKFYLCRYWLRGVCVFKKYDCRFAHGIDDLQIEKLYGQIDNILLEKIDDFQKPLKIDQKPLISIRTYRVLYYYQFELLKRNKLLPRDIKTVFEIDNVKEYREQIRNLIRRELIINFYRKVSDEKLIERKKLDYLFKMSGFYQDGIDLSESKVFKILQLSKIAFEREVVQDVQDEKIEESKNKKEKKQKLSKQKIIYMLPYRSFDEYNQYYCEFLIDALFTEITNQIEKIDKNLLVFTFLPLNEQSIRKYIVQKDNDIQQPGFYNFLRAFSNSRTIQDFMVDSVLPNLKQGILKRLVKPNKQWERLIEIIEKEQDQFWEYDIDMSKVEAVMLQILENRIQGGKKYISLSKFQKLVEGSFKKHIQILQTNDRLGNFMRDTIIFGELMQQKYINYFYQGSNPGKYIIVKEKSQNKQTFTLQVTKKCKNETCSSYLFPTMQDQLQLHNDERLEQFRFLLEEMGMIEENVRNTMVVDNQEKLQIAEEILKHCNFVAVDLEGGLSKGLIWLAQLGMKIKDKKRLIIIFDFQRVGYINPDESLYYQMLMLLKATMENPRIKKVFHDCRNDSRALHKNGICPRNVRDSSITYSLLQQITVFDQWKNHKGLSQSDLKKKLKSMINDISQYSQPSLNDVLLNMNPLHGQNQLKNTFHSYFHTKPKEYFLKRPHPEFMSYSAADVEDLTEVQTKMEKILAQYISEEYILEKLANKNLQFYL